MGILALACWLLLLPLADGIGVPHDDLIHPGEGLWKENGPLEEAQVAAMQRQGEDHILLLFWRETGRKESGGKGEGYIISSDYMSLQCEVTGSVWHRQRG